MQIYALSDHAQSGAVSMEADAIQRILEASVPLHPQHAILVLKLVRKLPSVALFSCRCHGPYKNQTHRLISTRPNSGRVPMRLSVFVTTQDVPSKERPPPRGTEGKGAIPHPFRLNVIDRLYYYYLTNLMTRDKHSRALQAYVRIIR